MNIKSSVINTALGEVEYKTYGASGPRIVAIHGTPGGYDQIEPYLNDIMHKCTCSVVAWSRPGYGQTPLSDENSSFRKQAIMMKCLMDELDIPKAIIYAISSGSGIAYHFAALYPERCIGLIIESGVSKRYEVHYDFISRKLTYKPALSDIYFLISKLSVDLFPRFGISMMLKCTSSLSNREIRDLSYNVCRDPVRLSLFKRIAKSIIDPKLRKLGVENDLRELKANGYPLINITSPALIIHGTRDTDVNLEHAEYASCTIENSTYLEVLDGTHVLPLSPRHDTILRAKLKFLNFITGKTGKGLDVGLDKESAYVIPNNYKRFPTKMPMSRVSIDDVVVVKSDGLEFPIYSADDPLKEYGFMTVLRRYGGVHGGVGINAETYTDLFRVCNEHGGFIPLIMFPALVAGAEGSVKIVIDGNVTEICIPALATEQWRAVIGGYFPHEHESNTDNNYVKMTLGEKKILNIVSPITDIEAGAPGLFFENSLTISFKGECPEEKHGKYSCFTYVQFTGNK